MFNMVFSSSCQDIIIFCMQQRYENMEYKKQTDTEIHPWEPFVPHDARVLIMGTFPPGRHRWSMNFYYPNPTNDFWRIMSLIFLGDKDALYDKNVKKFKEEDLRKLAEMNHIALHDTCREIRRTKGNASDKYLEIIRPVDLYELLEQMPNCKDIATTGEKAAAIVAEQTFTQIPKMGEYSQTADCLKLWRMPSTSRAYPMKIELKAEYYKKLFESCGII